MERENLETERGKTRQRYIKKLGMQRWRRDWSDSTIAKEFLEVPEAGRGKEHVLPHSS